MTDIVAQLSIPVSPCSEHARQVGDWIADLIQDKPAVFAEIGVYRGRTSEQLLHRFRYLRLYMIDWWQVAAADSQYRASETRVQGETQFDKERQLLSAIRRTLFAQQRRVIIMAPSAHAALSFHDESLDGVFIDGDHTYVGVAADLKAWYPKVIPGGVVMGHDIDNAKRPQWRVRDAVEDFRRQRGIVTPLVCGRGTAYYFRTPGRGVE